MKTIDIKTNNKFDIIDITNKIQQVVVQEELVNGIAVVFVPHTTAGVSINENADPDVIDDLKKIFNKMIPEKDGYKHFEGNSQAHALSTLTSPSLTVIVDNGKIVRGTWQNIYFMEYDGPRHRQIHVQTISK